MAIFLPVLNDLKSETHKRFKLTDLEIRVLSFFNENLDDSYEIYFRPFLNGFSPNIIIFKERSGIIVLDIFDCNKYELGILPKKYFESFAHELLSTVIDPHDLTVDKDEILLNIHGLCLIEKKCKFADTILSSYNSNKFSSLTDEYFFNKSHLVYLLSSFEMIHPALIYNSEIFQEIKRNLKPSIHYLEEGRIFSPNKKQNELILSSPGDCRIKGVAGTGKTSVIAHRAVNANARTNKQVLILTFNITIRHYIRYKLESVMRKYYRSDFHISHYHDFFKNQSKQYMRKIPMIGDWENENYFEGVNVPRYDTIIVDEAQDYKRSWVVILKKYFLNQGGEFVISFDENQDIFQVKETQSFPIKGRPNELSISYRLSNDISSLTQKFYTEFLKSDEEFIIEKDDLRLNFREFRESVDYIYYDKNVTVGELYEYVNRHIKITNSNPDDIAIIGISIGDIRSLEHYFRVRNNHKTTRMFESQEQYDELRIKYSKPSDRNILKQELKDLRRDYKLNKFKLVSHSMKFSSVHSFKGWEIRTLFFIINEYSSDDNEIEGKGLDSFITPELIYTGMTRARNNLFVINIGQEKYNSFFIENILV
jgi:superfamily I DNA/RNA helicase